MPPRVARPGYDLLHQRGDRLAIDLFPGVGRPGAHAEAVEWRLLQLSGHKHCHSRWVAVRVEIVRVTTAQFRQWLNRAAEYRHAAQRGLQQRDTEAFLKAGQEERIGQQVEVGNDRVGEKRVALFGQENGRPLQPQFGTQRAQLVEIRSVGRIVRAQRSGHDKPGVRQMAAKDGQHVQGELDILAPRHAHGQQQDRRRGQQAAQRVRAGRTEHQRAHQPAQRAAEAAAVAKATGADGIEIHCAHETLGYSFLSPVTNRRTDQWGGGPEQRVRFVVEALKRIRERVGDSIALGIRVGGQEFRQGGYDNMELREMLYCIGETGLLDFVDIDTGHCWGAPSYVPSSYHPHAEFREVGKAARADLDPKIKVLFTGRINDPVLAEELIRNGYCDLVGMVRAGIADPEFANKAREGRLGEIRRCIACTRCIDEASEPTSSPYTPTCSINPVIGNELLWEQKYRPAEVPKQVVVVGGGIAGCEAARVARMRGHQVTLLEQGKRLGGQLLIAGKAPGRDAFEDQVYFEENEMTRLGVDVRPGACLFYTSPSPRDRTRPRIPSSA